MLACKFSLAAPLSLCVSPGKSCRKAGGRAVIDFNLNFSRKGASSWEWSKASSETHFSSCLSRNLISAKTLKSQCCINYKGMYPAENFIDR